jgi:hypothetical protein
MFNSSEFSGSTDQECASFFAAWRFTAISMKARAARLSDLSLR